MGKSELIQFAKKVEADRIDKRKFKVRQETLTKDRDVTQQWLKGMKEKYPKKKDNPDDPDAIDYYEIEAKVEMLKNQHRKEEGKIYLDRMHQFS